MWANSAYSSHIFNVVSEDLLGSAMWYRYARGSFWIVLLSTLTLLKTTFPGTAFQNETADGTAKNNYKESLYTWAKLIPGQNLEGQFTRCNLQDTVHSYYQSRWFKSFKIIIHLSRPCIGSENLSFCNKWEKKLKMISKVLLNSNRLYRWKWYRISNWTFLTDRQVWDASWH